MFLPCFLATLATLIIGLIVFGGGQVFIPLFQWLWLTLTNYFGWDWKQSDFDGLIAISNLTPGVVSTKLAAITGFLVGNKQWWGLLILVLTYTVFVIPAILLMYYANKLFRQIKNPYFLTNLKWMQPIIIGILLSLVGQLLLGMIFSNYTFNAPFHSYWTTTNDQKKQLFFSGWRFYVLLFYVLAMVSWGMYGYWKKINFLIIFLIAIMVGLLVFAPWLF